MNNSGDIIDLKPRMSDFRSEVVQTLSQSPKRIRPKFFYDDRGSRLFDEITRLPEYYPTRSELEILRNRCSEISSFIGQEAVVLELGGGNGMKGSLLLNCLEKPSAYILVDISRDSLEIAVERLRSEHESVDVRAVWADYTDTEVMKGLNFPGRKSIVFLGSTIGNMEPENARNFLQGCRNLLTDGEGLTIGVDLKKDRDILERAYNDSQGVTAEFNLNLIHRINSEFGAELDPAEFRHVAFYNQDMGRIEMHLESLAEQAFKLDGVEFTMARGERIHTENSYKYSTGEFTEILKRTGFRDVVNWTDSAGNYALFSAQV